MDYLNKREKIIEAKNISKSFPGVKALTKITLDLYQGEIHCIVGENGAGKSTFIKILSGALKPDRGKIIVNDREYTSLDPYTSQEIGIQVIYQENILAPQLSVAENIFVGREKTNKFGFVDYREAIRETQKIINSLGIELDPEERIENLAVADQQFVKIIKALALKSRVIIMDEPTTMFNKRDVDSILELVKKLSQQGIGIIYISHNLEEVDRIADRVTVLRDGYKIKCHDRQVEDINMEQITKEMVGRPVDLFYKKEETETGDIILEINKLRLDETSPELNIKLRKGEILGVAGMVGAGRTEIVKAIYGANTREEGTIVYDGKEIIIDNPAQAIKAGIGFITEDRQKTGLALKLDLIKNITMASINKLGEYFINLKAEKKLVDKFIKKLNIKTPSLDQEVRFLSGGNQQKVVLARWLLADTDILIFDEPTRGIDVNAKAEIYNIMSDLVSRGKSIIMVSSDMPELIAMSDRIIVIRKGEVTAEIKGDEITEENIISSALGVNNREQTG